MSLISWYFRAHPLQHPAGPAGGLAAGPVPSSYMDRAGYLNTLSKSPNTLNRELPHGGRGNSQTQEQAFMLHTSKKVMGLIWHCICIIASDTSLVTVTGLHAAVNVFRIPYGFCSGPH